MEGIDIVDIVVLVLYFIGITCFGMLFGRFTTTTKDFFMAGQRFPAWLIAFSCIATLVGSYSFVKYCQKGFEFGICSSQTYLNDWFWMPLWMFGWLPILYFMGIVTVPEYFTRRFDRRVRVAAAVVLPDLDALSVEGLDLIQDSKSLTPRQRERGAVLVRAIALDVGVGEVSSEDIDAMGIVGATKLAMRRALDELGEPPDHLLVDGNVGIDWRLRPCTTVVKGDVRCSAVAAASVVAKVHRDAIMRGLDARYPGYGLGAHKGYAAPSHLAAIAALGPSPVHRMSFSPMRQVRIPRVPSG